MKCGVARAIGPRRAVSANGRAHPIIHSAFDGSIFLFFFSFCFTLVIFSLQTGRWSSVGSPPAEKHTKCVEVEISTPPRRAQSSATSILSCRRKSKLNSQWQCSRITLRERSAGRIVRPSPSDVKSRFSAGFTRKESSGCCFALFVAVATQPKMMILLS